MQCRDRNAAVLARQGVLALVVDDNKDVRDLYMVALPFYGIRVEAAADGHEALERALAVDPDVIVMDLCMPELDGDVAASRLKADERTRHIPLIAVSAHGFAGRLRAKVAGFDAFCAKPCLPAELVRVIESLLPSRLAHAPASGE